MTTLSHDIPAMIAEIRDHAEADRIVQGRFWTGYHGSFIGCLAKGSDPRVVEARFGVPIMIMLIGESIFERLPCDEAPVFAVAVAEAIAVDGKELVDVGAKFLLDTLMRHPEPVPVYEQVLTAESYESSGDKIVAAARAVEKAAGAVEVALQRDAFLRLLHEAPVVAEAADYAERVSGDCSCCPLAT